MHMQENNPLEILYWDICINLKSNNTIQFQKHLTKLLI